MTGLKQTCESVFPSREEEYDPFFFNPDTMFGAPYGGYARATRSRLAALPLRLVVDDNDNSPIITTISTEEPVEEDDDDDSYYTYRDGLGRLFACHLYAEEELIYRSITTSMFSQAIEVDSVLRDDVSSKEKEEALSTRPDKKDEKPIQSESKTVPEEESKEDVRQEEAVKLATTARTDDGNQKLPTKDISSDTSQRNGKRNVKSSNMAPSTSDRMQSATEVIEKQLKKLNGFCAQIHTGWWSYEWCHENVITQFHVHVDESNVSEKKKGTGGLTYEVQSVTNLGQFSDRRILHEKRPKINVQDNFYGGDFCEQSKTRRSVKVNMRCCTKDELDKNANLIRHSRKKKKTSSEKDNHFAIFVDVKELIVCRYEAEICTPLLCADSFTNMIPQSVDRDRIYSQDKRADSITDNNYGDSASPSITQGFQPAIIKKDYSIRDILQLILGNHCLSKVVGWWSYEFCHGKQLLQYHETTKMDQKTGFVTIAKETIHNLGHYDIDVLEGFPKEDEIQYTAWPLSKKENQHLTTQKSSHQESFSREDNNNNREKNYSLQMQKLIREKAMTMDIADLEAGGSGAVFIQEYFHGDFCEHPDVTESLIKGGSVSEGGIERSTTVRFSCGNTREFLKVNEDSTCHYIIDIALPELCKHHIFMAPVVKTKVVKCLLVDEERDDTSL